MTDKKTITKNYRQEVAGDKQQTQLEDIKLNSQ